MKQLYFTFIFILTGFVCASAQNSKLIGWKNSIYSANSVGYMNRDTGVLHYLPTNAHTPSAEDIINGNHLLCDTLIWYQYGNFNFRNETANQYNPNGTLASSTTYYVSNTTGLVNSTMNIYTYNGSGQLIADLGYYWIRGNNYWDTSRLITYNYDSLGNLIEAYTVDSRLLNRPVPYERHTYAYNSNNQVTREYFENYSYAILNIEPYRDYKYYYDGQGNLEMVLTEEYNKSAKMWLPNLKELFQYDTKNNEVLHETLTPAPGGNYTNHHRINTYYDGQGQVSYTEYTQWNSSSNQYKGDRIDSFVYNNKQEQHIVRQFNNGTGQYVNATMFINTYNDYGQLMQEESKSWNITSNSWELDNGSIKNKYYYNTPISIADVTPPLHMDIYPNPANAYLTITSPEEVEGNYRANIYDMSGRLVGQYEGYGKVSKTIPTSHLITGQYILELQTKKGSTAKQFRIVR